MTHEQMLILREIPDPDNPPTRPRCPICGDTNTQSEWRPNHVPSYSALGILTHYKRGTPTAKVMCAEGCIVSVRGRAQCAELAKAMGLPAAPFGAKEEG
jgi:hypothetical protein